MKREGKLNRLQKNMLLVAAGMAVIAGGMIALNPGVLFKSTADETGGGSFAVFPKADGIILKFKSDTSAGNRAERLTGLGLTERSCVKEIDVCLYSHNAKKDALEEVVDRARTDNTIQFAEENRVVPASFTDNKPDGTAVPTPPSTTNPLEAWKIATGKGVLVAIISSGVDEEHQQLGVRQGAEGYNFIAENANTNDKLGFGTALAGVILATSTNKFAGVAKDANYMPLKVTGNETADGSSTLWNITRALVYAGNKGAKVAAVGYDVINYEPIYCNIPSYAVNSSYGPNVCMRQYANPSKVSSAFSEGARYLKNKGGITVTSATVPKNSTEDYNNEIASVFEAQKGYDGGGYPAANIIPEDGVAFVAGDQLPYPKGRTFSNYTAKINGRMVTTALLGKGEIGIKSGAGMAVGQFAGVLALMREANPDLKADQLVPVLCSSNVTDYGTEWAVRSPCDEYRENALNYPSLMAKAGVERAKRLYGQSGLKTINAPSTLEVRTLDNVASEGAMFKVQLYWATEQNADALGYEIYRGDTLVTKTATQKVHVPNNPSYDTSFYDYTPLNDAVYDEKEGKWSVVYSVKAYDILGNISPPISKTIKLSNAVAPTGVIDKYPSFYLPNNISITKKSVTGAELSYTYPKQIIASKTLSKLSTSDTVNHKICYIIQPYTGTDNFRALPATDSKPVCMNNPKQGEVNSFQISGLTAGKLYQYWLYEMQDATKDVYYTKYKGLAYQVPLTSMFRTLSVATKEVGDEFVPKNILATPAADGKSATVYWTTDSATTAEVVYDIAKSADGKTVGDPHKTVADNTKQTKHTVTLETNSGLKYYYKIFSYAGSVTKQSDLLSFTAKGTPDLTITLGKLGNSATVSWVPSGEITYDVVFAPTRSKDGATVGDPYQTISSNVKTKTPSATLPGLTPNTTYFVKAISYAGSGAPASLDWSGCVDGASSITGDGKGITVKNEKGSAIGKHSDCRKLNNTEILGKFSYSGDWSQCKSITVANVVARGKVETVQSKVPFTIRFDDPQGGPSIYTIRVTCSDNATVQSALTAFTTSGDVK